MANTYPNTSNFKPTTVTDLSLKYDNDVTLSDVQAGYWVSSSDENVHVRLFKEVIYNIADAPEWNFRVFKDIPGISYITEVSDPNNNFNNILGHNSLEPNNIIDRGFITPYSGLYTFELNQRGIITGDDAIEKKGGFISFKIVSYPSSSINSSSGLYDGSYNTIYETPLDLFIYTSSRYNFELNTKGNSINSIEYSDTNTFGLSQGGALLPFNTLTPNSNRLYSGSIETTSGISAHKRVKVPRSGSYGFDAKIIGSTNITTTVTTPSGFQGTFATPNKTFTATLIVKKRDSDGNDTIVHTETQNFTVGGVTIVDPNPGENSFTDTRQFDLDPIFDISNLEIELDRNESVITFMRIRTPDGNTSGTETFNEVINGLPGFTMQLDSNFFRLDDTSFLKLNSYTPRANEGPLIDFLIKEENIELQLQEGDAIAIHGTVRSIVSESTTYPNSFIEHVTLPSQGTIEKVKLTTTSDFKVVKAINNTYSSGQHLSQPQYQGGSAYQPLEGSFLVDISDIQASITNPVLVSIPLHGFNRTVRLPAVEAVNKWQRNSSRKWVNRGIEVQLTTISNNSEGILPTSFGQPTHQVLQSNFMNLNRYTPLVSHNTARIARFDSIAQGYTDADLIENFPYFSGGGVFNIDNINGPNLSDGTFNNIFEGGVSQDTDIPNGARIKPRIYMTTGADPFDTTDDSCVVFAKPYTFNPTQNQFYESIKFAPGFPLYESPEDNVYAGVPGAFAWYKNYNFYTGSIAYNTTNAGVSGGLATNALVNNGFLNLDSASVENSTQGSGNPFGVAPNLNNQPGGTDLLDGSVFGKIVQKQNCPISLPIYFDQVQHDPENNYTKANLSPANYTANQHPGGTYLENNFPSIPSFPSQDGYGNLRGPDMYPNIRNFYEVPEDGFYSVAYNLSLIVEAAGGYGGNSGMAGKGISRFLNFHQRTGGNSPTQPAPTHIPYGGDLSAFAHSTYYDNFSINSFKSKNAANTLFGRVLRTPTQPHSPNYSNTAENQTVVCTSSLFRTDIAPGGHVRPSIVWYYNNPIGFGTEHTATDGRSTFSFIPISTTPDQEFFITDSGFLVTDNPLPETDANAAISYSDTLIQTPTLSPSSFASIELYQQYLNDHNNNNISSPGFTRPTWAYNGECKELFFYENGQYRPFTIEDIEALPSSHTLQMILSFLNIGFDELTFGLQQGLSDALALWNYEGFTLSAPNGAIAYQDFGNGNIYADESIDVNALLQGLEGWDLEANEESANDLIIGEDPVDETPAEKLARVTEELNNALGVGNWNPNTLLDDNYNIVIDGSNGLSDEERAVIAHLLNEKLDRYAWFHGSGNHLYGPTQILPDTLYGSIYSVDSQVPPQYYQPERVVMPISDRKVAYFYKGDRIHLEVALGPILPSGSNDWNDALNEYGNSIGETSGFPDVYPGEPFSLGPFTKGVSGCSSVGRFYVCPESFFAVSPVKGTTQYEPHLQFMVTGDNENTIVKGTYKYF